MNKNETLTTLWGEMIDLINCYQIEKGNCLPKQAKKVWTFDEAMALR